MLADLGFPLEWNRVRAEPLPALRAAVRKWLARENSTYLIHPHGFYVALLGRTETHEWRLHFWPKGPRVVNGMPAFIHTHNCHVESRILKGQLTNILYNVAADSAGGQPLYEVDYSGDRYAATTSNILRKTATRVQATIQRRSTHTCGDTYHVERCAYHEAVVSDGDTTSTLVCMHGRSPGPVMVVGLDGYPETIAFTRAEYRALDFTEWLSP
jgi:hypothetical protein